MNSINSKEYWDARFCSGDWEEKQGRVQTQGFAKEQVALLGIPNDFSGTILDFGCGLGDAIPTYKKKFPKAKIIGADHSSSAIDKCQKCFGEIATFIQGDHSSLPLVDVIISSNVFEHLDNDKGVAQCLLEKCRDLYIIVPYNECLRNTPEAEHVNSYNEASFDGFTVIKQVIYSSMGYCGYTWFDRIWQIWFKNLIRTALLRKTVSLPCQILFHLKGAL